MPDGKDYTFWGKGVSQGHSDAIRRIDGVKNAIQYTIPIEDALIKVRSGENPDLSVGEKHYRECFVAIEDGADKEKIEKEIVTMPNYFADYKTVVHFVSNEEVDSASTTFTRRFTPVQPMLAAASISVLSMFLNAPFM